MKIYTSRASQKFFILILLSVFLDFLLCTQNFAASKIIKSKSCHSKILNDDIKYTCYIPQNITTDTLPVVYLLYGLGGHENSWVNRDNTQQIMDSLIATKQIPPFMAVMPESRNSYYINNYDSSFLYSDFLLKEFTPYIDSTYHTNCNRHNRAILGISMGGYGAIVNTLKAPEIYGTCISLSAAVRTDTNIKYVSDAFYNKYLAGIYGEEKFSQQWINNSPYHMLNDSLAERLKDIHWYLDCGLNDYLLPPNKSFHQLLMNYQIPHEFHMRPGKHEWAYWRKAFIRGLIYWGEYLDKK